MFDWATYYPESAVLYFSYSICDEFFKLEAEPVSIAGCDPAIDFRLSDAIQQWIQETGFLITMITGRASAGLQFRDHTEAMLFIAAFGVEHSVGMGWEI